MCGRTKVTVTKPICVAATTAVGCGEMGCSSKGASMPYRIIWKAACLVLILNILKLMTIVLVSSVLILGSGDGWINPTHWDEKSIHKHVTRGKSLGAGEEPAVEGRARLLHLLWMNVRVDHLVLSSVSNKKRGRSAGYG